MSFWTVLGLQTNPTNKFNLFTLAFDDIYPIAIYVCYVSNIR
jgi:hypothetical protein